MRYPREGGVRGVVDKLGGDGLVHHTEKEFLKIRPRGLHIRWGKDRISLTTIIKAQPLGF